MDDKIEITIPTNIYFLQRMVTDLTDLEKNFFNKYVFVTPDDVETIVCETLHQSQSANALRWKSERQVSNNLFAHFSLNTRVTKMN